MAVKQWLGAAQAVKQISTVTIAGTWATNDTVAVTIGGATVTYTVGGTTDVTTIAAGLIALINASDAPAQFRDAVWTSALGVITATGAEAGVPFTFLSSKSSTSGTRADATLTACTGPRFMNNAANWSGGTLPVDGDTIVFAGSVPAQYGLDAHGLGGGESFLDFQVPLGYTGTIGLPATNARGYQEYRETYCKWLTDKLTIGGGSGQGSSMIKFDCLTTACDAVVYATGSQTDSNENSVQLKGEADDVYIASGNVAIAGRALESATVPDLVIGTNATVRVGQQATLTNVTTGGTTELRSACTTLNVNGGTCTAVDVGAITTVNISGSGQLVYNATATITTCNLGPGVLNTSDLRTRTITTLNMRPGGQLIDPRKSVTAGTLVLASNVAGLVAT